MLNKKDIDEKKFESSFRGYSKEEVDDFLDEVSASVGEMTAAFVTLEKKYESLKAKYAELEKNHSDSCGDESAAPAAAAVHGKSRNRGPRGAGRQNRHCARKGPRGTDAEESARGKRCRSAPLEIRIREGDRRRKARSHAHNRQGKAEHAVAQDRRKGKCGKNARRREARKRRTPTRREAEERGDRSPSGDIGSGSARNVHEAARRHPLSRGRVLRKHRKQARRDQLPCAARGRDGIR